MATDIITEQDRKEIVRIGKEFFKGISRGAPTMKENRWLFIDALSGFLNTGPYKNEVHQLPKCKNHPKVLVLTFLDGSRLLPSGADLININKLATDWMWDNINR